MNSLWQASEPSQDLLDDHTWILWKQGVAGIRDNRHGYQLRKLIFQLVPARFRTERVGAGLKIQYGGLCNAPP